MVSACGAWLRVPVSIVSILPSTHNNIMYCTIVAGSSNSATCSFWKQLFGEVRVTRQEVQKIREEQKKNTALLEKTAAEYALPRSADAGTSGEKLLCSRE